MIERLEEFDLDRRIIAFEQEFSHGLGVAYRSAASDAADQERRIDLWLAAGTHFRRAGSHAILLDDAVEMGRNLALAADCYAHISPPYATLLRTCVTRVDDEALRTELDRSEVSPYSDAVRVQQVYVFQLGAALGVHAESIAQVASRELSGWRAAPVGSLGLPVLSHLELALSIAIDNANATEAMFAGFLRFVAAFEDAIGQAREDSYHWRRLETAVHPADPELLGCAAFVEYALARREVSLRERLRGITMNPFTAEMLETSLGLRAQLLAGRRGREV